MDEQEKEIEEILRTFDKAPSPSSERNNQAQMRQNNLQSRQISQKPIDAERTARTSNQTAYICIPNTAVNYPVMFTPEEPQKYLRKNLEGEYSVSGVPFLDGASTPECDNLIVYGHNMKNGTMFGSLKQYDDLSFLKENALVRFDTIYEKGLYEIMYVFRSRVYSEDEIVFKYYQFIDAQSEQEFDSYMNDMEGMSLYDTGVTASFGDRLLTLSTCDYQEKNVRFVVVAKKVTTKE